jgi:Family of unknown function (DUF6232)
MRTYYRGRDAMVTSELFVRRVTPAKSYAVRDLRNVVIACDQGSARSRPLVAATAGFLGLIGAVAALATGRLHTLILLAVTTILGVAGTLLWPRRPVTWELRASYRGRPVSLYSSAEVTVFNQVTRALRRSVEADRQVPAFEENDAA